MLIEIKNIKKKISTLISNITKNKLVLKSTNLGLN